MDSQGNEVVSLERKSVQPYATRADYLYAMKEDLAEWFNSLYMCNATEDTLFRHLETGVLLCQHANAVQQMVADWHSTNGHRDKQGRPKFDNRQKLPPGFIFDKTIPFRSNVRPESFQARDNVSNFISWCRSLGISDVLLFETDDLVLRKNERSVVLCMLEMARIGARFGMLAPQLVQLEQEIEREIAGEPEPFVQRQTCDLMSLDEMVREILSICTCPSQFPMIRVSEGKYRIGDSQTLIFVRILRNHVMVRVGGGWDTLEHFLDKHDPCRCKSGGHRLPRGTPVKKEVTLKRRASLPAGGVSPDLRAKTPTYESPPTQTYQPNVQTGMQRSSGSATNLQGRASPTPQRFSRTQSTDRSEDEAERPQSRKPQRPQSARTSTERRGSAGGTPKQNGIPRRYGSSSNLACANGEAEQNEGRQTPRRKLAFTPAGSGRQTPEPHSSGRRTPEPSGRRSSDQHASGRRTPEPYSSSGRRTPEPYASSGRRTPEPYSGRRASESSDRGGRKTPEPEQSRARTEQARGRTSGRSPAQSDKTRPVRSRSVGPSNIRKQLSQTAPAGGSTFQNVTKGGSNTKGEVFMISRQTDGHHVVKPSADDSAIPSNRPSRVATPKRPASATTRRERSMTRSKTLDPNDLKAQSGLSAAKRAGSENKKDIPRTLVTADKVHKELYKSSSETRLERQSSEPPSPSFTLNSAFDNYPDAPPENERLYQEMEQLFEAYRKFEQNYKEKDEADDAKMEQLEKSIDSAGAREKRSQRSSQGSADHRPKIKPGDRINASKTSVKDHSSYNGSGSFHSQYSGGSSSSIESKSSSGLDGTPARPSTPLTGRKNLRSRTNSPAPVRKPIIKNPARAGSFDDDEPVKSPSPMRKLKLDNVLPNALATPNIARKSIITKDKQSNAVSDNKTAPVRTSNEAKITKESSTAEKVQDSQRPRARSKSVTRQSHGSLKPTPSQTPVKAQARTPRRPSSAHAPSRGPPDRSRGRSTSRSKNFDDTPKPAPLTSRKRSNSTTLLFPEQIESQEIPEFKVYYDSKMERPTDLKQIRDALLLAKPRKDEKGGARTKIPMPIDMIRRQREYGEGMTLKRVDSGVDITNISPTDTIQSDYEVTWNHGNCSHEHVGVASEAIGYQGHNFTCGAFDDDTEYY